ncbi:C40 family peptidase [Ureibacillus aquaedulcis]|uniref:NlpC/P60 family protein n=1 Tax=Ureibacillus aquaedulcis TaxID=3058421 RepID=A0ABT8GL87_9BACL|nr:C40 family peptidase [Ureibacillus sp. BA0131]MDN4492175.1 NlpC/P60 family protein [Ureibacillus sp. BA0131]
MKKRWLLPVFASLMLLASPFTNDAEAATNKELTTTAYKYIGVPYTWGGTTSNGFDCSGFTQKVFSDLGINLGRTTSTQYASGNAVSKSNLEVGDLVFFNTSGRGVSHVGIFVGNGQFVHASSSRGVTVSKLSESYWANRYLGAREIADFPAEQVAKKVEEVKSVAVDFSVYASRAEVANQLAKALNLDTSNTTSKFSDVKSSNKYAGAITALQKQGIFQGDENGKFNPNSPITRAEMAKVLVLAFDLKLQDNTLQFTDVKKGNWAYDYVNNLASNKVTLGLGNGAFGAKDNVTLTQLGAFIERAMN